MDWVERLFWSLAGFIGIHFVWLGLIERHLPLWIGTGLAVVFLVWFYGWGWRRFSPAEEA